MLNNPSTRHFRSDIQGLRAIAVLSVIVFHVDERFLPGGFVGVDIFFVISGFLITSILLSDFAKNRYSVVEFYRRRIVRLFPALFSMLAVVMVLGGWLLSPSAYKELADSALATLYFGSNFFLLFRSDYFGVESTFQPLLHTWSLAVEEQFYIIYPILLLAAWRYFRSYLGYALLLGAISSLLISVILTSGHRTTAFYLAPTRAYELLIGAIVATSFLPRAATTGLREVLSLFGLALILSSVVFFDHGTVFPGYAALMPCMGTGLLLHVGASGETSVSKLMSRRPLTIIGDISYPLYLWHWPVLVFCRHYFLGEVPPFVTLTAVGLAGTIAYISHIYIEKPTIDAHLHVKTVLVGSFITVVIGVASMISIRKADGVPDRFSSSTLQLFSSKEDFNRSRDLCHSSEQHVLSYSENCSHGSTGKYPDIAIWADSHGAELAAALGEEAFHASRSVMQITASACPPALHYARRDRPLCRAHNAATLAALSNDSNIVAVVLAYNFSAYPEADWSLVSQGLQLAVAQLTEAGKKVVLVGQIPIMPYDPPTALGMYVARGRDPLSFGVLRSDYDRATLYARELSESISRSTGAVFVDVAPLLCNKTICPAFMDGVLYFNRDHLSLTGARRLVKSILAVTPDSVPSRSINVKLDS